MKSYILSLTISTHTRFTVLVLSTEVLIRPCFKQIEKINATAPQPQRNILKYFKNVAHSLEPGETPSDSASHHHQAPNYVQRS